MARKWIQKLYVWVCPNFVITMDHGWIWEGYRWYGNYKKYPDKFSKEKT